MTEPTTMPHPADFRRMAPADRQHLALMGAFDDRDWRIDRVAHLCGLDAEELSHHVEAERGWEPHDHGFLHEVVVSAAMLLERDS